jgi:hypothetical protein
LNKTYAQECYKPEIVITGFNASQNSFKFMLLKDLQAESKIIFTDFFRFLNETKRHDNNFEDIEFDKLEGLLLFESREDLTAGNEFVWTKGKRNFNFTEYGNFYLSSISDEIIILKQEKFIESILYFAYGKSATDNINSITSDQSKIIQLPNIIENAQFSSKDFNLLDCVVNEMLDENNWSKYIEKKFLNKRDFEKISQDQNEESNTLEIMPFGDSVTRGKNKIINPDFVGYRRPLYKLFDSVGYNVNIESFLGSVVSDTNITDFDTDHEGHGGYQVFIEKKYGGIWRDLYHNIDDSFNGENWFGQNSPNYVLLHIGTNDLGQDESPDSVAQQLSITIDKIFSVDDSLELFLAKIINVDSLQSNNWANTETYNNLIDSIVLQSPHSNQIHVINMEEVLDYENDLIDDVHPNDIGYNKMAKKWFSEIQKFFSPIPNYPHDQSSISVENANLSWQSRTIANSYNLQISEDSVFSTIISDLSGLTNLSHNISDIFLGQKYFWRIRAENFGGYSSWSEIFTFSTFPCHLNLKVNLEGRHSNNINYLLENNLIPTNQPFNKPPWNYIGDEKFSGSIPDVVDWVLVSLSTTPFYSDIIFRKSAILTENGQIISSNGDSFLTIDNIHPGEYYIMIEHRNHIKIASSGKIYVK